MGQVAGLVRLTLDHKPCLKMLSQTGTISITLVQ